MKRRHLITISLTAALIILIAGYLLGSFGEDQVAPRNVNEPAPNLEDEVRFEQLATVLNQSATGSYLLGLKETYRITVKFEAGHGSTFNQDTERILLDANHDVVKAGLYFAHEMHHARTLYEGKKADLRSESRQSYIDKKLKEEAEGMVASIRVKIELEEIGADVTDIILPLEDTYRQAYQEAAYRAGLSAPSLSPQELDVIGIAAGEQALFDAFASGEIRTSNTHEPYTDYYGDAWDEVHTFKALVADLFS